MTRRIWTPRHTGTPHFDRPESPELYKQLKSVRLNNTTDRILGAWYCQQHYSEDQLKTGAPHRIAAEALHTTTSL